MNLYNSAIALAIFAASMSYPAIAMKRCDVDPNEYPKQHTMPNGETVTLVWRANQCGSEHRGVWVKVKTDGGSCGLGYRCERRHRGR